MGKIKKSPIVILFAIAVVLYAIIYILPRVTGVLRSSYTAEYGELKTFDKAEGFIVRNEFVYFSNKTGSANRYIEEDKLVRRGTRIMEVKSSGKEKTSQESEEATEVKSFDTSAKGNSTYESVRDSVRGEHHIDTDDFVTEQEGILSYHVDGYESLVTPETMSGMSKSDLNKLTNNKDLELNREVISETDPVFKICDRAAWYIICYIPREHEGRYSEGTKVDVRIDDEKTISGTVMKIEDERREKRLTIKTNHYYSKFTTVRKADIEVITSDVMGLLISNTSIVEEKKQQGVYVRQKTGKYVFVPINVIATDGTQSAISPSQFRDKDGNTVSTVRSYDDILRRPDRKAS